MTSRRVNIVFLASLFIMIAVDVFAHLPGWMYLIVFLPYIALQSYGSIVLSSNFFVKAVCQGTDKKMVALTFDDGPVAGKTERILDILNANRIKGAFFCIGKNVESAPDLTKRIFSEGHIVGNHSYFHGKLFDLQLASTIQEELAMTDVAIEKHVSRKPRFFRPPYGVTNPMVAKAIRERDYVTVGWSLRSFDTMATSPDVLLKNVSAKPLDGGDIILFHDHSEPMIQMLPKFIEEVRRRGFRFVGLDELINERAYV